MKLTSITLLSYALGGGCLEPVSSRSEPALEAGGAPSAMPPGVSPFAALYGPREEPPPLTEKRVECPQVDDDSEGVSRKPDPEVAPPAPAHPDPVPAEIEPVVDSAASKAARCWWAPRIEILQIRVEGTTARVSATARCPTRRDFGSCIEQLATISCTSAFDWKAQTGWLHRRTTCDSGTATLMGRRNACKEPGHPPLQPFDWPGYR